MSREKYVQQTLTLPAQMPLFNYNINFEGLKKLLEGVNLKTNNNEQSIIKLQQNIRSKLPTITFQQTQKRLNSCLIFGIRSQQYIDQQQNKAIKIHRNQIKKLPQIDQYCWKMNRMAEIVQLLIGRSQDNQQKISNDGKRYEKMLEDSIRRLQEKLNSQIDSFSQTINSYFSQTNKKVEQVAHNLSAFKLNTESKWMDLSQDLGKKVSDNGLKAHLEGIELKIKRQLQGVLKNDQMLRLGLVNQIKQAKIDNDKDQDLKNKSMAIKMQQLNDRVAKAMQTTAFDVQKHKIYERLSELKNRGDDFNRKNNEFVQFRKAYLTNNEKVKQQMICIRDEIKKLNQEEGSSKKGQGIGGFNSHIICELEEAIKLHQKQIGKLEKQLLSLDKEVKNGHSEKPKVQVNFGQSSDLIQKIIKEFMSNMDFEGRVKRTEREMAQLKKRHDNFSQIQKKVYVLTKEMNMSWLVKEMDKKCNEEDTRKEIRIVDSKIQQLFEYYKQLRKEVQEKKKVIRTEPIENASLITKKLVSVNCISCKPNSAATRRNYSKKKFEASLDYGLDTIKSTIVSRMVK